MINAGLALVSYSEDNPTFGVDKTLLFLIPKLTRVSRVIQSSYKKLSYGRETAHQLCCACLFRV